jgi:heme/copper-type cytochrome/quinol oxidase subunit 2
MRQSRSADAEIAANGRLEIVWTLVPASLIAALALMLGGFNYLRFVSNHIPDVVVSKDRCSIFNPPLYFFPSDFISN